MKNSTLAQQHLLEVSMILLGTSSTALTYYLFMKANNIIAPGLGGVAIIIGHFLPITLGIIYFVLNIPLFLLGFRYAGGKFVIYSLIGMFSLSIFLSLFKFISGFQQPFIGTIFGGILNGASIALVLLAGGSTGGVDIACVVVNRLWPKWTIGKIMFFINFIIVILSGILFGFLNAILTIISIYLASKSLDICYSAGQKVKEKAKMIRSNLS